MPSVLDISIGLDRFVEWLHLSVLLHSKVCENIYNQLNGVTLCNMLAFICIMFYVYFVNVICVYKMEMCSN